LGLLAPRKDDLYVFNGRPFTLSEFNTLRLQYPSLKPEGLLQLAVYATVAQKLSVKPLDLRQSTERVRNLILPRPQGAAAASSDGVWLRDFDAAGPKELEDRLRSHLKAGATRWNIPLLQEIGISEPPWG
jgi:hypothetical protein